MSILLLLLSVESLLRKYVDKKKVEENNNNINDLLISTDRIHFLIDKYSDNFEQK